MCILRFLKSQKVVRNGKFELKNSSSAFSFEYICLKGYNMKRCIFIIAACILFVAAQAQVEYVNPMVGTDGHGHTFPGATVPFGMVQLRSLKSL